MIEISHAQAQHLIRESLDRPIAESQWSALQVHLEQCSACRSYRDRRLDIVREAVRLLRERWWTVMLQDGRAFPAEMIRQRQLRRSQQKGLRIMLVALIAFVIIAGYSIYARVNRPARAPGQTPTPVALATQTAGLAQRPGIPVGAPRQAGSFRGQVLFDAPPGLASDGTAPTGESAAHEIYLLNQGSSGPELTNLTAHPAHDDAPAWSPDGQWVAFLSNREIAGQADIYVMTVAGTRLTRLTAVEGYRWLAPLTWSADGRWLAAVAQTPALPDGAIFLVPTQGAELPRLVPDSRGGRFPTFSQPDSLLAYQVKAANGQAVIHVYDVQRGARLTVTAEPEVDLGIDGALDWSADGYRLVFVAQNREQPQRTQARAVYSLPRLLSAPQTGSEPSTVLISTPAEAPLVSVGLSREGELLYAQAAQPGGCALIYGDPGTHWQARTAPPALELPSVCLLSRLERASWTQNGPWLLMKGHAERETADGLYAMYIPGMNSLKRGVLLERLMDLPAGSGAPQVRPDRPISADFVPIEPRAGLTARASGQPPAALLERVLATYTRGEAGSVTQSIGRLTSAGLVDLNDRLGFCPRRSPDGQSVAFVSSRIEPGPGWDGLFVMDVDSGMAVQVSNYDLMRADAFWGQERVIGSLGGCPSWSPDNQRLATYVTTDKGLYLSVFDVGGAPGLFYQLSDGSTRIPPRWTSGSKRVAVARGPQYDEPAQVVTIYPDTGVVAPLAVSDGWQAVADLAYSPDGRWLGYVVLLPEEQGSVRAELRIASGSGGADVFSNALPAYPGISASEGYSGLTWLTGLQPGAPGRIGLSFAGSSEQGGRSALMVYDLSTQKLSLLIDLEEDLRAAAWSPEGNWVIYSVDSGTYALYIPSALAGKVEPSWLGIGPVDDLNWR